MPKIEFSSKKEYYGCLMFLLPFLGVSALAVMFIGNESGEATSMTFWGLIVSIAGFFIVRKLYQDA